MASKEAKKRPTDSDMKVAFASLLKEPVLTRRKRAQLARQLRSAEGITRKSAGRDSEEKVSPTRRKGVKRPVTQKNENSRKSSQSSEKSPTSKKSSSPEQKKKVKLKIKHNYTTIMSKRKQLMPRKKYDAKSKPEKKTVIDMKVVSDKTVVSDSDTCYDNSLEMPWFGNFLKPDPDLEDEMLTDSDLNEIMLCPSPVWWEDEEDAKFISELREVVRQDYVLELTLKSYLRSNNDCGPKSKSINSVIDKLISKKNNTKKDDVTSQTVKHESHSFIKEMKHEKDSSLAECVSGINGESNCYSVKNKSDDISKEISLVQNENSLESKTESNCNRKRSSSSGDLSDVKKINLNNESDQNSASDVSDKVISVNSSKNVKNISDIVKQIINDRISEINTHAHSPKVETNHIEIDSCKKVRESELHAGVCKIHENNNGITTNVIHEKKVKEINCNENFDGHIQKLAISDENTSEISCISNNELKHKSINSNVENEKSMRTPRSDDENHDRNSIEDSDFLGFNIDNSLEDDTEYQNKIEIKDLNMKIEGIDEVQTINEENEIPQIISKKTYMHKANLLDRKNIDSHAKELSEIRLNKGQEPMEIDHEINKNSPKSCYNVSGDEEREFHEKSNDLPKSDGISCDYSIDKLDSLTLEGQEKNDTCIIDKISNINTSIINKNSRSSDSDKTEANEILNEGNIGSQSPYQNNSIMKERDNPAKSSEAIILIPKIPECDKYSRLVLEASASQIDETETNLLSQNCNVNKSSDVEVLNSSDENVTIEDTLHSQNKNIMKDYPENNPVVIEMLNSSKTDIDNNDKSSNISKLEVVTSKLNENVVDVDGLVHYEHGNESISEPNNVLNNTDFADVIELTSSSEESFCLKVTSSDNSASENKSSGDPLDLDQIPHDYSQELFVDIETSSNGPEVILDDQGNDDSDKNLVETSINEVGPITSNVADALAVPRNSKVLKYENKNRKYKRSKSVIKKIKSDKVKDKAGRYDHSYSMYAENDDSISDAEKDLKS